MYKNQVHLYYDKLKREMKSLEKKSSSVYRTMNITR